MDPIGQTVFGQPGGPAPRPPPPALGQHGVAQTPQRGCGWVLQQGQAGTSSRPLPASWRFPG